MFVSRDFNAHDKRQALSLVPLLLQPMKPLKAAATTSQPVLTSQQIETIFFKVPELYEIHKEFYDGLFPRVQQWSHQQRVGDLFQKLVSDLGRGRSSLAGGDGAGCCLLPEPETTCGPVLPGLCQGRGGGEEGRGEKASCCRGVGRGLTGEAGSAAPGLAPTATAASCTRPGSPLVRMKLLTREQDSELGQGD